MRNENNNTQVFSNRLLIKMREMQLSQKNLSLKAQISPAAINHYINGTRAPKAQELNKLATALGITMDWLWGRSDDYPKQSEQTAELVELRAKLAQINSGLENILNKTR